MADISAISAVFWFLMTSLLCSVAYKIIAGIVEVSQLKIAAKAANSLKKPGPIGVVPTNDKK